MMKQRTKNWLGVAALVLTSSAVTGVVMAGTGSSASEGTATAESTQEMPFNLAEP